MLVIQESLTLSSKSRGFHLITKDIIRAVPEISKISKGIANIFIKHTSASLTISENADPTVRMDLETFYNRTVPEDERLYKHTDEGADDMTSHIKNSILGSSLSIPVKNGNFLLGTWQGIYLCEHRNYAHNRQIVITIIGEKYE